MERHKLWILVIGGLLLVGLGAWLLRASGAVQAEQRDEASALRETASRGKAPRRASARPELATQAKAAITGTVRARTGEPIAHAQVCAWPRIRDLDGLPPGRPRCTKSQADGHYRLEQLMPVAMVVNAEARGYFPQRWFAQHAIHREKELQLHPGQAREGVDFVLREGGTSIEGVVRDISGGVVEGAFVWVEQNGFDDPGRSAARSDAEGRFSLWSAPGRVIVHAQADGYAHGQHYSLAPGSSIEVVLTPESVITGRVVMAGSGEPVAGVVIEADAESFFSEGGGRARSDDDGKFRIDKLEPGIYKLDARADELYGEASELVHLGLAQTAEGLLIELHPAFLVTGKVVIAGGASPRPCQQGFVRLADRKDKGNSRSGRIRSDGEVEIHGVLPGNYEVDARCTGMVSELEYPDLELKASVADLIWEVREGLAIRGEIIGTQGSPAEGVQVFASMKADPADPRKQMTSGSSDPTLADGRFTVAGLLPGTYEVRVSGLSRFSDAEPLIVELEPGADVDGVRLELPGTGAVTGIVVDADSQPISGIGLLASSLDQQARSPGMSDDEGRFVIDDLPPGRVRIVAFDGGTRLRAPGTRDDDEQGTLAEIRVGETPEVVVVIESRKATIRGRVLDEHGSPVADAFVRHQRMSDSAKTAKGMGKAELRHRFDERPVLTEPDGSFVIEGLAADASYVLGAFRKGGGEAIEEDVSPGEPVELTIRATGAIAGTIVTTSGEALPERMEITIRNDAEVLKRSHTLFRSNGAFRHEALPAGTYTLIVESPAGSARVEGVELGPGEIKDDLIVSLSPRVTVRGRLVDLETREPIPGMSVSIRARGTTMGFRAEKGGDLPHISDAEGRFEVADALTGKVRVSAVPRNFNDSPYDWMMIDHQIPQGSDIVDLGDIELVASRTGRDQKPGDIGFEVEQAKLGAEPEDFVATVAVIRPGGPADTSGLEVGDRIETVNGHDVRGTLGFRLSRLTAVPAGETLQLGIAGGKTVTITAGPPIK